MSEDWIDLPSELPAGASVDATVLTEGLSEGVRVVELAAGGTRVCVCPTRGLGILWMERHGKRACWDAPVSGPVHPKHVDLKSRNGLGWLDGFTELLVRCGLSFNGPPGTDEAAGPLESNVTLHGRIANRPAFGLRVQSDETGVALSGVVEESTLFGAQLRLHARLHIDAATGVVSVEDRVENFGPNPAETQLLYHINVGPPFLAGGSRVEADHADVAGRDDRAAEGLATWSECLPPTDGYAEQVYFLTPPEGEEWPSAALTAPDGSRFEVMYQRASLPCLSVWKCTQPESAGYVCGLEPGTNWPNFKAEERADGRVPVLAPGESREFRLRLSIA